MWFLIKKRIERFIAKILKQIIYRYAEIHKQIIKIQQ